MNGLTDILKAIEPLGLPAEKVYLRGDVLLLNADCLAAMPLLLTADIDAMVTDPPYGIGVRSGTISETRAHKNNYIGTDDDIEYVRSSVVPIVRRCVGIYRTVVLTPGSGAAFLYPAPATLGGFYQPASVGMCSWGRQTFQPILFYGRDPHAGKTIQHTTYTLTEAAEPNGHPCPKPLKAWTWVMSRATKCGDTVVDPFMGSATGAVACLRLGHRAFIGIEREPAYFDIACDRLDKEFKRLELLEPVPPRITQAELFQ